MNASPIVIFILAALGLILLAKFIGESIEEISVPTGPALGGLLNATFGNATELIISIFALQARLTQMVKASITGSIIGNLLLILNMAFFFGGLGKDEQEFNNSSKDKRLYSFSCNYSDYHAGSFRSNFRKSLSCDR